MNLSQLVWKLLWVFQSGLIIHLHGAGLSCTLHSHTRILKLLSGGKGGEGVRPKVSRVSEGDGSDWGLGPSQGVSLGRRSRHHSQQLSTVKLAVVHHFLLITEERS